MRISSALRRRKWQHLDSIVTGDETWAFHFTPETKQQSREWRHSSSPKLRNFKTTQSAGKVMATVFWDQKGVLLVDFMAHGTAINADRYCETLKKLRRAIQNRRRGMLTKGVCLLHDNARPMSPVKPLLSWVSLDGTSSPTHPIVWTWHPVTTTCFLSWKNIWPEGTSATMTRWKLWSNASSTTWQRAGMTWAYKNCLCTYKNASTEMVIM